MSKYDGLPQTWQVAMWSFIASHPGGVCTCSRPTVISMSACPLAYLENYMSELHQIFMHVACGCGSVLLWWCCDALGTSTLVDDIIFSPSWLCCASCAFISGMNMTTKLLHQFRTDFAQWYRLASTGTKCAVYDCFVSTVLCDIS